MTNEQILEFVASMNYAHLVVDSSCHMRYGRERWERGVQELSVEQRSKLVSRIEHWQELVEREQVRG
jgi:hypothetical protein